MSPPQELESSKALPVISTETIKQQQRSELKKVQGEISESEIRRIAELKQQMLEKFKDQD